MIPRNGAVKARLGDLRVPRKFESEGSRMIIEFPRKSREIETLADLLAAIERPWAGNMDVRPIAIHIARMRLAVRTVSELLQTSPSAVSTDWLLSLTVAALKDMALGVAPPYRREFLKASQLLIQHAQIYRDNEAKYAQPLTAGLDA